MSIIDTNLPEEAERRHLEWLQEQRRQQESQEEVTRLRAEVERLRRVEADAAALRLAFERAAQAYFTAMNGKPRQQWTDEPRSVWNSLYEAVRDNQAGLTLLAELERTRKR